MKINKKVNKMFILMFLPFTYLLSVRITEEPLIMLKIAAGTFRSSSTAEARTRTREYVMFKVITLVDMRSVW